MGGLLHQLDGAISAALDGWNWYTTLLTLGLLAYLSWLIYDSADADTHPLLLARQAQAAYVRQAGESAVFRAPETPHGYPLRTGLAVRPAGAPMYSAGRDGDVRDIWRRLVGDIPLDRAAATSPATATLMTVYGNHRLTEHNLAGIANEIAVVGQHLNHHGARRVAVYLPNSIEFLAALFAGAFYAFTPVLIPYNQPHHSLVQLLVQTNADALIAEAGSVPLSDVVRRASGLGHVIWTVDKTSRHMGWSEVPEGIGGKIDVSLWHELVADNQPAPALPTGSEKAPGVVFLWQEAVGKPAEMVEFSQQNLAAAVGSLITALPAAQRFTSADTFLPADAFTHSYSLCLTLAALFSHATVIINSVAAPGVDLTLATRSIAPTIAVVSAETAAKLHSTTSSLALNGPKKFAHYLETRMLTAGRLPADNFLTRWIAPLRATLGTTPGKLRLLFVSERAGLNTPPLSPEDLSDLRIYTKARVLYALTAAKVAGAVAQTNVYDYRRAPAPSNKHSHFGVPLSCLEIKVKDTPQLKTTDEKIAGELVVTGSSVAGGETSLGLNATIREDHTLAYV